MSCGCSLHVRGSGIVSMYEVEDVAYIAASGQQLVSFHNDYLVTMDTLQNKSLMFESYTTELCIYTSEIQIQTRLPSLIPRPFPPPVFDHLQYAHMKGRRR